MKSKYILLSGLLLLCLGLSSCNDFLDREPLDSTTPGQFFKTEGHLAAYTIGRYSFDTKGGWGLGPLTYDNHTDNMANTSGSENRWVPEKWLTSQGGSIGFGAIRQANYFLVNVLPKYEAKEIQGSDLNIRHYIGEMYFLRAKVYFENLVAYGDFPILTTLLPDVEEILVKNSVREPRSEVARFILSDLDQAIEFMSNDAGITYGKNRLSKNAALLFKSRVALFEGSWLKYHAGTSRVPNGPNWPGEKLHPDFQFKAGSIEEEVKFFLNEAVSSSEQLLSIPLQGQGAGKINQDPNSTSLSEWNTYFEMFGAVDMSKYQEVLFWRQYSVSQSVTHGTSLYIRRGGNTGLTKGFVDAFLMDDGKPYYTAGNKYKGDETLDNVRANRDSRLQLFMLSDQDTYEIKKKVDEENHIFKDQKLFPFILNLEEARMVTGYGIRKGFNLDPNYISNGPLIENTGSIVYRVAEAYLNYLEASYMLNGNLTATAKDVWGKLRTRAGMDASSIDVTIQNTDLEKEAEGDWAVYSAGNKVDATLYNIRRERRCELIGEGMRWDDLKRWAALNQIKNYEVKGFNLWSENYKRYTEKQPILDAKGEGTGEFKEVNLLIEPGSEKAPNVSSKADGNYILPYKIQKKNNALYNGYNFRQAKYLSPIPIRHIELASPTGSVENSNFYQNPGWPLVGASSAIKSSDSMDN